MEQYYYSFDGDNFEGGYPSKEAAVKAAIDDFARTFIRPKEDKFSILIGAGFAPGAGIQAVAAKTLHTNLIPFPFYDALELRNNVLR